MIKITQLVIFFILTLTIIIFYFHFIQPNKYQNINSDNSTKKNLNSKNLNDDNNNLIENLKYEVTINKNYKYTLLAERGTIINKDSFEYINMQNVKATILNQNNIPLIIKSNKASYNNSNFDTIFSEEVKIEYLNNLIVSDIVELKVKIRKIIISQNIKYNGPQGKIFTDNIVIDLENNKFDIFMNETNKNVKVIKETNEQH